MAKVGRLVKDMMIQELETALKERPAFFVTSLGPLPAADTDGLRKKLAGSQARMLVIKRTLGLRGVGTGYGDGLGELFSGSIALVLPGEEVIPAAKLLVDFAKASQEKLIVRGGVVDGQLLTAKRVEELANLPPRPQLMAAVVGALESPMSDLIFTIERVLGDIAWILEEAAKKQPAAPAAGASAEQA